MRNNDMAAASWLCFLSLTLLLGAAFILPLSAQGQNPGNNAVYGGTTTIAGSTAYIDAAASANASTTICATLYNILNGTTVAYPTAGAVIDARGLNSSNSNLTCAANTSPWLSGGTYLSKPSRILLPAGTIIVNSPWVVPAYTKIVGAGSSPTSGASGTTTIQAANPGFSGSALIQMGDSTCAICFEISLTDLTLDAHGLSIDGVDNSNAEEQSFLQHVAILNAEGTGLFLSTNTAGSMNGTASHSGPYVDLLIAAGSAAASGTACVKIFDAQPRGIHGLTCTASSTTPPKAGIYLDGGNVSLEDITLSGFNDGILVGAETPFGVFGLQDIYANLLSNISGSTPMTNLIHICNSGSPLGNCSSTGFSGTQDIVLTAITGASGITNTIEDDLTTTLVTDVNVGLYALGEPVQGNSANVGYSRFTTSMPHSPTWLVGTAVGPNGASCTALANGSLYSRGIAGGSGKTLWACISGAWTAIQ